MERGLRAGEKGGVPKGDKRIEQAGGQGAPVVAILPDLSGERAGSALEYHWIVLNTGPPEETKHHIY